MQNKNAANLYVLINIVLSKCYLYHVFSIICTNMQGTSNVKYTEKGYLGRIVQIRAAGTPDFVFVFKY